MSAKLRSLIDYLTVPLRFWRRGRRLPARLQVTVLLAGALCLGSALAIWSVARATPQEEGGGDPTQVQPEGRAAYEQMRQLRTTGQPAAARALATEYLDAHLEPTVVRQLVHYEYAAALYSEHRHEEALAAFQQVATNYGALGLEVTNEDCKSDDALYMVGTLQVMTKQFSSAYQTFMSIYNDLPTSSRAIPALQHANRALIHEELDNWDPQNSAPDARTIDHAAAIEANVAAFVSAFADDAACASTLEDVLNYHMKRGWWNAAAAAQRNDQVVRIVAWMQQVVPDAVQTTRATLALATVLFPENPQQALALTAAARQRALALGDDGLLNDADFTRGGFLSQQNRQVEARAAWSGLLDREQDPQFEGHVKILIGCTYFNERQYAEALSLFDELATTARYPDGVRAAALVHQAMTLRRVGQAAEALAALDQVIAEYPTQNSAGTARALSAAWTLD